MQPELYGNVRATSRRDDNHQLAELLQIAQSSVDILFITGKNTFDNQRDEIASALIRGVRIRLLLFDHSGPHAAAMASLLSTDAQQLASFALTARESARRARTDAAAEVPEAAARLQARQFSDLLAFDLILVDSYKVWFHPMMPVYEPVFPSFLLFPPSESDYARKLRALYDELFARAAELAL